MTNTASLLTAFETCPRQAYWSRVWQQRKLTAMQMLQKAIRSGLMTDREDFGEYAGEQCYGMGIEPGLQTVHFNVHDQVVHLACLADIVTTAIRKPQEKSWLVPKPVTLENGLLWESSALLDPSGKYLRRIVLVSSWNNDRHYSECRSWFSLGEVAAYNMPMQIAVIVLGPERDGKRHSAWAKGLLHPNNKQLRFRKKYAVHEPFKETWEPIWREDHDEISTALWLQNMLKDGVLPDLCFSIKIDVLEKKARQRVLGIAAQRFSTIDNMKTLPDEQYTACSWPVPCTFLRPCHHGEAPSANWNFVKTEEKT
jgi:hypothetical protein